MCPIIRLWQEIEGGLNSSTATLLTSLFCVRLFSALSPVSGNKALMDGTAVFTTSSSPLRSLLRSTSASPIGSFPGSVSVLLCTWSEGLCTWSEGLLARAVLRDSVADPGAIDGLITWDATQMPLLDSRGLRFRPRASLGLPPQDRFSWSHRHRHWVLGLPVQMQWLRGHRR